MGRADIRRTSAASDFEVLAADETDGAQDAAGPEARRAVEAKVAFCRAESERYEREKKEIR